MKFCWTRMLGSTSDSAICYAPEGAAAGAGSAGDGDAGASGAGAVPPGDAGAAPVWTEGMSEATLEIVTKNGFENAEAAIVAFDETQRMVGGSRDQMLFLPGAEATAEDWAGFYARAGRPENADGYQIGAREGGDEAVDKGLATLAHQIGLRQNQFEQLRDAHYDAKTATIEAYDKTIDEGVAKVEGELSAKHGETWASKQELINRGAAYLTGGDGALANKIEDAGLTGDLLFVERLISLGEAVTGDGSLFGGGGSGVGGGRSPASAKAEIQRLEGDTEFRRVLNDKSDPGHKAALARRDELYQTAFPEGGA